MSRKKPSHPAVPPIALRVYTKIGLKPEAVDHGKESLNGVERSSGDRTGSVQCALPGHGAENPAPSGPPINVTTHFPQPFEG